jgi:hypothetical protein
MILMDITLREYLAMADASHDYIDKFGIAIPVDKINKRVKQLHVAIKNIQSVAKRIADVANVINQLALHKKTTTTIMSNINPYPTENDHATLRATEPSEYRNILNNINIPVKNVEKSSDIPTNYIYYIKSLKQYAINIAGTIIKGNLGNIVNYQGECSARCEYGIKCKSFDRDELCKYYHDPEDYITKGKNVPDRVRNYTVGSWIYTKNKKSKKAYFARHVGNKETMMYDLAMLKRLQYREEISNREGQLIHDLLTYMILHNKGMLERYPHWGKI